MGGSIKVLGAIQTLSTFALIMLPSLASAATASVYTSITEKDCSAISRLTIGGKTVQSAGQESVHKCEGPPGHALYIIDDGTRSWYALERHGRVHSLENNIVHEFRHGDFPNVPGTGRVEWLTTMPNQIVGLIKYQRQSNRGLEPASVLFAYNLQSEAPEFLGASETNVEARFLVNRSLK
jgi:hypothetical protein